MIEKGKRNELHSPRGFSKSGKRNGLKKWKKKRGIYSSTFHRIFWKYVYIQIYQC
jgi:hypothetical protein